LFPLRYYIHYNVCICCYYLCILLYRYLSLSFCCLLCLNYCLVTHKCCRHRLLSLNMCMSLTHGGDDEHHNNTPSSQHILLYPYLSLSFVHCPAFVFAIVIAIVIIHPYSQGLHVRLRRLLRVLAFAFVIVIDDSTVATVDTVAAAH